MIRCWTLFVGALLLAAALTGGSGIAASPPAPLEAGVTICRTMPPDPPRPPKPKRLVVASRLLEAGGSMEEWTPVAVG